MEDKKIDKKRARKIIVILLIIADLLLLNYFRDPLIRKYFTDSARVYSAQELKTDRRYLVSYGDYIKGIGFPNAAAVLFLRAPGTTKKISKATMQTDNFGEWVFKIPENIPQDRFSFIAGFLDKDNNLLGASVYKLRVNTNVSIYRTPLFKSLQNIKYSENEFANNYSQWTQDISSLQVFPARESNEIENESEAPISKQEILQ